MKEKWISRFSTWVMDHILLSFVFVSIVIWGLRSLSNVLLGDGSFYSHLLPSAPQEIAVRLLMIAVFLLFGAALQFAVASKIHVEKNYRELVQFSNSIILRMNDQGNVTFFNKFAQEFFGFSEDEILGKSVIGTIVPETETTGKDMHDMISDIITDSENYKTNINENMKKNGERVWVLWTNKSFQADKKHREILCIGSDMTKIKEAEDKLKEAMDMKDRFVSMASHEIRSPLAAIQGAIDLIGDGLLGPLTPDQKHWIGVAKDYIVRLNRISTDILTVQKFEAGKMVFEMSENDINATVSDVIQMMQNTLTQKGLELIADPDASLPKFIFDKDRIIQVLINLINNAGKFTDQGSIRVTTRRQGESVQVSVTDTGCGMSPEEIPKVFEKFEQLKNARERKAGGTGLGLSIAKEIVLAHGGKIWVESELNRGTSFRFTLPFNPPAA